VIEKECFNGNLEKIDESIEAADVRELMSDDRTKLGFRKAG